MFVTCIAMWEHVLLPHYCQLVLWNHEKTSALHYTHCIYTQNEQWKCWSLNNQFVAMLWANKFYKVSKALRESNMVLAFRIGYCNSRKAANITLITVGIVVISLEIYRYFVTIPTALEVTNVRMSSKYLPEILMFPKPAFNLKAMQQKNFKGDTKKDKRNEIELLYQERFNSSWGI